MRFGEKEIAKEKFYAVKKSIKDWGIYVDNIVIPTLIETKTNSKCCKCLIGIKFDKAITPLTMPKMSIYFKTFKTEDKCLSV